MTFRILLVLGMLSAFGPMAIDLYLPSFPALATTFGVSVKQVQMSLAAYFVGLAIGQLIYGPVADRYGRQIPLLVGASIFVIASAVCAYAPSLEWLIAARFVQALGGCAGMVISRAIVRDLCTPLESAKVFSQLMLIVGLAPILAPLMGGWLLAAFGWRSIFLVLVIFGVICLYCIWRWLPETAGNNQQPMAGALRRYITFLGDPALVGYGLAGGLGIAGMFAYIAASPFVFIDLYGVSPSNYGWLFGANAAGFIFTAQLNSYLLRHHGPQYWLQRAVWVYVIASLTLLVVTLAEPAALWPVLLPLFVSTASLSCILPNATACAMAGQGANAGSASAMLGFLQFGVAASASAMVGVLHDGTGRPMGIVIFGCALATLAISSFTVSRIRGRGGKIYVGADRS
ncbi:multidrug effflux MFS transporter [Pseudomonas sp. JAI120]|uniref:multidrug effflux MFS transporter n=1 Tax=Pseudomonas sp. JAI120 TaxID=2723063 RepID=UPI0030EBA70E